ncbi:MAG TPA: hypothetical protein VJ783_08135 [Pirellulales bacterium]|nr:hypothetical protein [Pirellulales bacterium]
MTPSKLLACCSPERGKTIVPSHDRQEKPLRDQNEWANAALDLFGELYGGATAFQSFQGVYKADDGRLLRDRPILIECYAERVALEDRARLSELLSFAKRMGRETKQEAVALIINDAFYLIKDFR